MCRTTNQSSSTIVIDTKFEGEYSIGGSEWKKLDADTKLSSFDGDLTLRGHLSENIPYVNFYLNHIGITISVNGEEIFYAGRCDDDIPEMMCGSYWDGCIIENGDGESEIEIRLHNPHKYGNADAYNEFLDSLVFGGEDALENRLNRQSMPYRIMGISVVVVSVALLGMSLGYIVKKLPSGIMLWLVGMMALFMGGYILIDTKDIEFRSRLIIFNTCARQLCIMFSAFFLTGSIRSLLAGKANKLGGYLTAAMGIANGILLILCLTGTMAIYDTGIPWAITQGIVSLILLVLCIAQLKKCKKENRVVFVSYIILLSVLMLELVNARVNMWTSGIVIKYIFVLFFVFYLVRAVKLVIFNHKASVRAMELSKELRNSRIVLAMSQIRTHFIFNILTAISGMCEYNPQKADQTLICFARYLRSNIDIMQDDEPEEFIKSLKHLEDYVVLEQIRFEDRIKFVKNLEVTDFKIPPLILQPVVENAIKHGLLPKAEGGTVELSTGTDGKNVIITIKDDGVGFDVRKVRKQTHIGLDNVRFRLEHMVNGRMNIESSIGNGTKITIMIPYDNINVAKENLE